MSTNAAAEECLDCLCLASRKAARAITRVFDRKLRPLGMRATQFSLLTLIRGFGPLTIGSLAERSATERTTLTRNLALLESAGWVKLETGDDARERTVAVTKQGAAAIAQAVPVWREAQAAAKEILGAAGAASLIKLGKQMN